MDDRRHYFLPTFFICTTWNLYLLVGPTLLRVAHSPHRRYLNEEQRPTTNNGDAVVEPNTTTTTTLSLSLSHTSQSSQFIYLT
jgi:hypothetical protein